MKKRNLSRQLYLVLFLSFFLQNCEEKELVGEEFSIFKTVSIENAKRVMEDKTSKSTRSESIEIIPDWSTVSQDALSFSDDALLTNVEAIVTSISNNDYSTKLLFLEIDGSLLNIIETSKITETFSDGKIKDAKVFYHSISGNYLKGFKISNGLITHELVANNGISSKTEGDDCDEDLDDSSTFCDNTLAEIVISTPVDETPRYVVINYYDFTDGSNSGGSTGGGNDSSENAPPFVDSPDDPIENMEEYLDCFDSTQGAKVTIYAEQPDPENPNRDIWMGDVGHSFISIEQNGHIVTFGFYPASGIGLLSNTTGTMGNDQNHNYHVSASINISASILNTLLNHSISFSNSDYNLQNINCTSFAISSANIIGLNIPLSECIGNYGIGLSGASPARLGEYMRDMDLPNGSTRNTDGGDSPSNNGC
ncbi:MAG: hypothetical protein JXR05_16515 [Flavobacteriaceae bacterium]